MDNTNFSDLRSLSSEELIAENARRRATLFPPAPVAAAPPADSAALISLMKEDFALWCEKCVTIRHKLTGKRVPLRLNAPQRAVVAELERQRRAGLPMRIILLKSRQWGGSTVIQMYMAWIQCLHRTDWNSYICAHVKDTSATIRGMYTRMLESYPPELWIGDAAPGFRCFERSANTREISGRGCLVTVGSAENQDAARGADISMAHLSEVAFWKDTSARTPADLVRSVCSGIPMAPMTLIALESTANGVGNFFHSEWLRAKAGDSAFVPLFVPWHAIEAYTAPVSNPSAFASALDEYGRDLWNRGLCLEQIAWYMAKRRESASAQAMMAEYPSDDVEAFVHSGDAVFSREAIESLRRKCRPPRMRGELGVGARFIPDTAGCLEVWETPDELIADDYVVAVDIGGRSHSSDWSVIAVLAIMPHGHPPRIVAQWRGHIDHDILARKAIDIARFYNDALLVVESNTLETEASSGGSALYILERAAEEYPRIYRRRHRDSVHGTLATKLGFHMNSATKQLVITELVAAVREQAYIETDVRAADEMAVYERLPSGGYAARRGHHDDILITRAIALYVAATLQSRAEEKDAVKFVRRN